MSHLEKLCQLISENKGIITTRDLAKNNIPRTYLQKLVKIGQLVRVERGIYCSQSVWNDDMYALQYRFSRGIFSHNTALYLHGLTDRTPLQYEMTFPQGYNPTSAKSVFVKARTVSLSVYELGKVKKETLAGQKVVTYDIERTLCDMVKDTKSDYQILLPALKKYIASKTRNIQKLMQYAKILKVEKKMQRYLEVLL